MPRPLARARSRVVLCTAVAYWMILCAGCSGAPPAGNTPTGQVGKCIISSTGMLTQRAMPGFVEVYRFTNARLPGSHGIAGHAPWDITQYVCGQSYSFISNVIMHGRYRAGDDALARSLGYPVGKIPLLPYEGPAVSQLPHGVFEVDEEVFQFRSPRAAETWLANGRWSPTPLHYLAGLSLPSGFRAIAGVTGADNGRDQHGIGISGQQDNLVIVVSFNGGRELAWPDVKAVWYRAYTYLAKTLPAASATKDRALAGSEEASDE